eukprot:755135-Hanusia_phi.AAC.11
MSVDDGERPEDFTIAFLVRRQDDFAGSFRFCLLLPHTVEQSKPEQNQSSHPGTGEACRRLADLRFWVITLMTTTNLLALAYPHSGNKLFLVVHLLEIFNRSRVLQNVMKSVTFRANTLLQTAGLALIFIYFFGVSGFYLFPELFQFAEADIIGGRKLEPNNNGASCTSVWKCTLVVLDMGLRKVRAGGRGGRRREAGCQCGARRWIRASP